MNSQLGRGPFATPPITLNLIIANFVVWLACTILPIGETIRDYGMLYWVGSEKFHVYQIFTYMFLHADFSHMFFNMFSLWMFGRTLELEMGWKRFLIYYIVCGVGAALFQMGIAQIDLATLEVGSREWIMYMQVPTVGASGAIFGLLLAFGMMHPNAIISLIFPPISMKAKWFVLIYAGIELLLGISGAQSGVAHFAHLGGMIWGFALLWWWTAPQWCLPYLFCFLKIKFKQIKKNDRQKSVVLFGGEGGTRTLAPVLSQPTPLAGAPRHHLSTSPW